MQLRKVYNRPVVSIDETSSFSFSLQVPSLLTPSATCYVFVIHIFMIMKTFFAVLSASAAAVEVVVATPLAVRDVSVNGVTATGFTATKSSVIDLVYLVGMRGTWYL